MARALPPGLPDVDFGYQESDEAVRARWLIVGTVTEIEGYGVARYGSLGFAPGTWTEFYGTGASFTRPGLPGSYQGTMGDPFDPTAALRVVGGGVYGCLIV